MRKIFSIFILSAICLLYILVNIRSTYKGYFGFYHEKESDSLLAQNGIYQNITKLILFPPVNVFLGITGLESGSGFFAPNVASSYVVRQNLTKTGYSNSYLINTPRVSQKESTIRIRTGFSMFKDYLAEQDDTLKILKCDVFLKRLSDNNAKGFDCNEVTSNVYLFHKPLLSEVRQGKSESKYFLIRTKQYDFKR